MSKIFIKGMEFYAHHGCFEEERLIGTWFEADLEMEVDTTDAERTDNIENTVDYSAVYQVIKREMDIPSRLLEHVARRILTAVKNEYPQVISAKIRLKKLNPPLGGKMKSVGVEMEMRHDEANEK